MYVSGKVIAEIFAIYLTENVVVALSPMVLFATCEDVVAVAAYANPLAPYGDVVVPEPPVAVMRIPNCSVPTAEAVFIPPIAAMLEEALVRVAPCATTL